ncbi:hypothetical protein J6590_030669 [Homalodisca vitripennis]|nr:hypothetical protein J6590_030669 [Homalodisca vitripennis]
MQLVLLNSLLMFDIVFMFFLFLVGVSCVAYYLPSRPPLRDDEDDPETLPLYRITAKHPSYSQRFWATCCGVKGPVAGGFLQDDVYIPEWMGADIPVPADVSYSPALIEISSHIPAKHLLAILC